MLGQVKTLGHCISCWTVFVRIGLVKLGKYIFMVGHVSSGHFRMSASDKLCQVRSDKYWLRHVSSGLVSKERFCPFM